MERHLFALVLEEINPAIRLCCYYNSANPRCTDTFYIERDVMTDEGSQAWVELPWCPDYEALVSNQRE